MSFCLGDSIRKIMPRGLQRCLTEYPLAFADALRMTAAVNLMEFAMETIRRVQENGTNWNKWTGTRK